MRPRKLPELIRIAPLLQPQHEPPEPTRVQRIAHHRVPPHQRSQQPHQHHTPTHLHNQVILHKPHIHPERRHEIKVPLLRPKPGQLALLLRLPSQLKQLLHHHRLNAKNQPHQRHMTRVNDRRKRDHQHQRRVQAHPERPKLVAMFGTDLLRVEPGEQEQGRRFGDL